MMEEVMNRRNNLTFGVALRRVCVAHQPVCLSTGSATYGGAYVIPVLRAVVGRFRGPLTSLRWAHGAHWCSMRPSSTWVPCFACGKVHEISCQATEMRACSRDRPNVSSDSDLDMYHARCQANSRCRCLYSILWPSVVPRSLMDARY